MRDPFTAGLLSFFIFAPENFPVYAIVYYILRNFLDFKTK